MLGLISKTTLTPDSLRSHILQQPDCMRVSTLPLCRIDSITNRRTSSPTIIRPTVRVKNKLLGSGRRKRTSMNQMLSHVFFCCHCVVAHGTPVQFMELANTPLTFYSEDKALPDGHSQWLMGDCACKLFPWVTEWSGEVEKRCQREGVVRVVFVARQQSVRQNLGNWGPHPLAWCCWVLLMPNYLHIQRVITLCLTSDLLLPTYRERQSRPNVEGDTGSLWGEKSTA